MKYEAPNVVSNLNQSLKFDLQRKAKCKCAKVQSKVPKEDCDGFFLNPK